MYSIKLNLFIIPMRNRILSFNQRLFSSSSSSSSSSSIPSLSTIRGTHDIFPPATSHYSYIENIFIQQSKLFSYNEIRTPILEHSGLFQRSLGNDSDIVKKEMFLFDDHGNSTLLRPEATASVARAVLKSINSSSSSSNNNNNNTSTPPIITNSISYPQRYYYLGPMFRRERPQRGRFRQFTQFGVEFLFQSSILSELELFELSNRIIQKLKLSSSSSSSLVQLELNSLGDIESRKEYIEKLYKFLYNYRQQLSEESRNKLELFMNYENNNIQNNNTNNNNSSSINSTTGNGNILRILDSKYPMDQLLFSTHHEFPYLIDSLNSHSKSRFYSILNGLKSRKIEYHLNHRLVRGLDYYSHTAFEYTVKGNNNNNNNNIDDKSTNNDSFKPGTALLAGGRYDSLLTSLNPKLRNSSNTATSTVSAIGWAAGIERILLMRELNSINDHLLNLPMKIAIIAVSNLNNLNIYNSTNNNNTNNGIIEPIPVLDPFESNPIISYCWSLGMEIRMDLKIPVLSNYELKLDKQMNIATLYSLLLNSLSIRVGIIIGSNEIESGNLIVKDFITGEQMKITRDSLYSYLIEKQKNINNGSK